MNTRIPILSNYQIVNTNGIPHNLGFGAYGKVQLGKCLKTGKTVAIKKISRKLAIKEVQIHRRLKNPNIIQIYDYGFDEQRETTYLVLEYAQNGTLYDCISQNHGIKNRKWIKRMFYSVCDAIEYMHNNNIMHRDIKPQNILLDRNNFVKLCDFGYATDFQNRTTFCGTFQYMAPQMILRKSYNHKIDIWGLGILLFELIQGNPPFKGRSQEQILQKMKNKVHFSKKFMEQEIELIHKILKVDPKQRPQISEINKFSTLHNSKSMSRLQINKKFIDDKDKIKEKQAFKKIKIVQVKDLTKKNIQIKSIKQISNIQNGGFSFSFQSKTQKDKISLKKSRKC